MWSAEILADLALRIHHGLAMAAAYLAHLADFPLLR